MVQHGLVHIYTGDGKGKTTAAVGLALRMLGNGGRVLMVQFLKDGSSGEIKMLQQLPNVQVLFPHRLAGFTFQMSPEQLSDCREQHHEIFEKARSICQNGSCDLLIFDEVMAAISENLFEEKWLTDFLHSRPKGMEVVLTGRNFSQTLLDCADYISEIEKLRHPFDRGVMSRKGIEE